MKVENSDLEQLRDLLQTYKQFHDRLFSIEKEIDKIDEQRESLVNEISSIKDMIELTGVKEDDFKSYMTDKYGYFDVYSILNNN